MQPAGPPPITDPPGGVPGWVVFGTLLIGAGILTGWCVACGGLSGLFTPGPTAITKPAIPRPTSGDPLGAVVGGAAGVAGEK